MKNFLIKLAWLPFALAILWGAKVMSQNLFTASASTALPVVMEEVSQEETAAKATIQVALLLDVSGSMNGLLEQAKARLWQVVNELSEASVDGISPNLEISLYIYGGDALPEETGYVQMLSPMTNDLDYISEKLFALSTNGGEEYCGTVIQAAHLEQMWSDRRKDLKMIFIAGNEPFNQGHISYEKAVKKALNDDIIVNTIFCGDFNVGAATGWRTGALVGGGQYLSLDHNQEIVNVETPYDEEFGRLNSSLNETYYAYNQAGLANKQRQIVQDNNAIGYGSANMSKRAKSKATKLYCNDKWDLVDAFQKDGFSFKNVDRSNLPAECKNMNDAQLKSWTKVKMEERQKIQAEILILSEKRETFIAEQRKTEAEKDKAGLGHALSQCLRKQAVAKGYTFEK
ncbi:MAG: vWA domain-containing protein [Bacteroidota bacterium]